MLCIKFKVKIVIINEQHFQIVALLRIQVLGHVSYSVNPAP